MKLTLERIEESQGKLLAAIDALSAAIGPAGIIPLGQYCQERFNNQAQELGELRLSISKLAAKLTGFADGLGTLIGELRDKLDAATDAKCDRLTLDAAIRYHLKQADRFRRLVERPKRGKK